MEIIDAFRIMEKALYDTNSELGFSKKAGDDNSLVFGGEKGVYRVVFDAKSNIVSFECAYEDKGADTEFNTISKSLFEPEFADDKDAKSLANEVGDEIASLFKKKKKVDLEKVKMPKAVSRTKAKNGIISYDCDSLANRFGTLYPEFKDEIKKNVAAYGEFLPETFFMEYGTPKVLDVIKNGTPAEQKKLFKMLGEIYEDGTNEVQYVIGLTILG